MSKQKKSVHKTGALGALLASGQLSTVGDDSSATEYKKYLTKSGIGFTDDEFIYVDPNECEPWEYANRHEDDFDGIEELKKSIQQDGQLQPVLVREHENPHDNIKYEVIFGRRRHLVCKELGLKMMAICKRALSLKDALKLQHTENEQRRNVSNYSNALIYKKLLDNDIYKSQRSLAAALDLAPATVNDLMYYTKISPALLNLIGSQVHRLPTQLARKIVILCEENPVTEKVLLKLADKIGTKITSPTQLVTAIKKFNSKDQAITKDEKLTLVDQDNRKILDFKKDYHGNFKISLVSSRVNESNYEDFLEHLKSFFEGSKLLQD